MVDLKIISNKPTSVEEVNEAIKDASIGNLKNVLGYNEEQLVSSDFNHNPLSSIFHADQTKVINGNLVRVMSWYDNEWVFQIECVIQLMKYINIFKYE